jgi:hypothetical protein
MCSPWLAGMSVAFLAGSSKPNRAAPASRAGSQAGAVQAPCMKRQHICPLIIRPIIIMFSPLLLLQPTRSLSYSTCSLHSFAIVIWK